MDNTIHQVVINTQYGGFSLSKQGLDLYFKLSGDVPDNHRQDIKRDDPYLVEVVNTLGNDANGKRASLKIVNIPVEFKDCYKIKEYDGLENIDLSAELLVSYKLENVDINQLSDEECRKFLHELQDIRQKYPWY